MDDSFSTADYGLTMKANKPRLGLLLTVVQISDLRRDGRC
jgi:hypothetical protein